MSKTDGADRREQDGMSECLKVNSFLFGSSFPSLAYISPAH